MAFRARSVSVFGLKDDVGSALEVKPQIDFPLDGKDRYKSRKHHDGDYPKPPAVSSEHIFSLLNIPRIEPLLQVFLQAERACTGALSAFLPDLFSASSVLLFFS